MKTGYNGSVNIKTYLANLIASPNTEAPNNLVSCFLYQFTDQQGNNYYFTDGGFDCVAFGQTWLSSSIQFKPFTYTTEVDSDSAEATIVAFPSIDYWNAATVLNKWFYAFQQGLFDATFCNVYRGVFANNLPPNMNTWMGGALEYGGFVGKINQTRTKITIKLNDVLTFANIRLPKNLFQPGCSHVLYDAYCTVSRAGHTYNGTIDFQDPVLPEQIIYCSTGTGQPAGTFQLGTILFTSGLNSGLTRAIKFDWGGSGQFTLMSPLPNIPNNGDTVTAYWGCDKTLTTCVSTFNNINNFRGFPFLPPETVFY